MKKEILLEKIKNHRLTKAFNTLIKQSYYLQCREKTVSKNPKVVKAKKPRRIRIPLVDPLLF